MHGRVSHVDKGCSLTRVTAAQSLNTHPHPRLRFPSLLRPPPTSTAGTATSMTSSRSQITSGPASKVEPYPESAPDLQLKRARRAKLARESEALRIGTCPCPKCPELNFSLTLTLTHPSSSEPPLGFLEWPTIEGLEEFVEKRVEYDNMMHDDISDLQAVIREQLVYAEGMERAANLAEERRLQEFQRALERMDPVEAEAAQRAERERALRLQREYVARVAELEAEWTRIRARMRAESPYDSADEQ